MDKWKDFWYTLAPIKGDELIKVTAQISTESRPRLYWVYITTHAYKSLLSNGSLISIKEFLTESTFKFLESGPDLVSDNITEYKGFIQKAFITNATANATANYAFVYLTSLNLTGKQIDNLRLKYSLGNLGSSFSEEEIKNSLINQSAYFLNLCKSMNENDRFIRMAENLDKEQFNSHFKFHDTIQSLRESYDRRVFHNLLECESIRSNYEEEKIFYLNTGVFAEKNELKSTGYLIDTHYLEALKMRLCKKCVSADFKLGRKFGYDFTQEKSE